MEYMNDNTFALDEKGKRAGTTVLVTGIKGVFSKNAKKAVSNNLPGSAVTVKRGYGELTASFSGNTSADTYIDLPLINYKGYAAYLDGKKLETGDGVLSADVTVSKKKYSVSYGSALRVYVGDAAGGEITVRYEGTFIQKASKIVTLLTLLAAVGLFIRKKVRSKSQTQDRAL